MDEQQAQKQRLQQARKGTNKDPNAKGKRKGGTNRQKPKKKRK